VDKQLLKVEEAAEALQISKAKCWQLVRDGRLRSIKLDWSRRIPVAAVQEFIAALEQNGPGAA
jgi:excisionase family DNA binding protein